MKLTAFVIALLLPLSSFSVDRLIVDYDRLYKRAQTSLVWDSVNMDLDNHLYAKFRPIPGEKNWMELEAFYFNDFVNHLTFGKAATALGHKKLEEVSGKIVRLNVRTGRIYLGQRIIGYWYGKPSLKAQFNKGLEITAPLYIDEGRQLVKFYDSKSKKKRTRRISKR
jgi:hypothetical protein